MAIPSLSTQGREELTLLAPLKKGLSEKSIELPGDLSYPVRLGTLLLSLFGDRKREVERDRIAEGLLEELQIIHSVQWTILDSHLMLAVIFDGPWEPYIRIIVDRGGPLLDMIFSHCEGYEGSSCADGYRAFARWVRAHQIKTQFLYGADTGLTVDDARYLKQFEATVAAKPLQPDTLCAAASTVITPLKRRPSPHWFEKTLGLFKLSRLYPDEETRFNRMSALILQPEFGVLSNQPLLQALTAANPEAGLVLGWLSKLTSVLEPAEPKVLAPQVRDRSDVQGSILSPYTLADESTTHGCVALVRFRGRARAAAFLALLRDLLTTEPEHPDEPNELTSVLVNLGLTRHGLEGVGVEVAGMEGFPAEFLEGLAARAGMLGDIGRNHPEHWDLPLANWPAQGAHQERVPLELVDAVVMLQTRSDADTYELLPAFDAVLQRIADTAEVLHVQPTRRYDAGGHFGLADGLSQPMARGDRSAVAAIERDLVPLGELLLGYPNSRDGALELQPEALFENSTFMALRKMTQDVAEYERMSLAHRELALGRRADGTPLERASEVSKNDFEYPAEETESRCPHFAHVRRANPRTSEPRAPRILRRGMSFGPPYEQAPEAERGLMFTAFAANLAEQYEVVQRWVNAGNSAGTLSSHPDLIAGPFAAGDTRQLYFSNALGTDAVPLPARQLSVLSFGLYAFVPSRRALEWLEGVARGRIDGRAPAPRAAPTSPIAMALMAAAVGAPPNAVETPPQQAGAHALTPGSAAMQMKVTLEGGFETPEAKAFWRDVQRKGAQATPFAVMVASQEAVQDVLLHPERFSVRSYWARMRECAARSFLGMDPNPVAMGDDGYEQEVRAGDHHRESAAAKRFVGNITREQAFGPAFKAGSRWLNEQRQKMLPDGGVPIDLPAFGRRVIRDVAEVLFGLPAGVLSDGNNFVVAPGQVKCPFDLTVAFIHVFPPRPSEKVTKDAVSVGQAVYEAARAAWPQLERSDFVQALRQAPVDYGDETENERDARELRTLLGVLSGFAVPTNGHLVSVLAYLANPPVDDGTASAYSLARLRRELVLARDELRRARPAQAGEPTLALRDMQFLYEPLYQAMIAKAVPERVHRTVVAETSVGGVKVKPGDLVAVSIAAAADDAKRAGNDDAWKLLFGDLPANAVVPQAPARPIHACPAQDVAIGVLLGALVALLEFGPMTPTSDTYTLMARPSSA